MHGSTRGGAASGPLHVPCWVVCVCVCVFSGFADFVSMILAILLHVNIMGFKQTGLVLGAPRQEIRGLVIGR